MKISLISCIFLVVISLPSAHAALITSGDVIPADPPKWTSITAAYIGNTTTGILTVDGNSDLFSQYGYLGYNSGSIGTVTVDGAGSTWTNSSRIFVGYFGSGTLNISDGGIVGNAVKSSIGQNIGSTGTVTVDGSGSTWNNSSTLYIGSYGNGALNISDGGCVSNTDGYLGYVTSATGTVTVDGDGSTWSNSGDLYIGRSGDGTMNITNLGAVSVAGVTYVGYYPDSTGVIDFGQNGGTLATESLWASPSQLTGTGTITTHGLVSDCDLVFDATHGMQQTIMFNNLPGQNISINLDMTGNSTTKSHLGAGWKGTGSLSIRDGVAVTSGTVSLGHNSGSIGVATVDGAKSTWTNSDFLYVGYFGSGALNITHGGSVSTISKSFVGYQNGSTGTVMVDGSDSTWNSNSPLCIGFYGSGTMNITNGGSVNSNHYVDIGNESGSTGTVTVDGDGSTWTIPHYFSIGGFGNGTLNITGGGSVINTVICFIGFRSNSTGTVMLDGADSTWINSLLYVGDGGTGNVIQTSGTHLVDYSLVLGWNSTSTGTYNLIGGTLILKSLVKENGTALFNFGGGTLQASGDFVSYLPMTLTATGGNANVDTAGFSVDLSGELSGAGGLNKLGDGTLILSATNDYSGETDVNSGVLIVNGSLKNSGLVVVNSSGTFSGIGKVGQVVVNSGGHIAPGDSLGTLTLTGNLTLNSGALLDFELGPTDAADKISMASSSLTLTGQQFADFTFTPLSGFGDGVYTLIDAGTIQGSLGMNLTGPIGNYRGTLSLSGNDLLLTVVPEPAAWLLLAPALFMFIPYTRRRFP